MDGCVCVLSHWRSRVVSVVVSAVESVDGVPVYYYCYHELPVDVPGGAEFDDVLAFLWSRRLREIPSADSFY